MIGTPLVRETTVAARSPSPKTLAPPVLIEVPALHVPRPHRFRLARRYRAVPARPRRRLRREVRWLGLSVLVLGSAVSAAFALRAIDRERVRIEQAEEFAAGLDLLAIELDVPIPEPAATPDPADPAEAGGAIGLEMLPVAFPGYLLPGESEVDGDEEYGHARP